MHDKDSGTPYVEHKHLGWFPDQWAGGGFVKESPLEQAGPRLPSTATLPSALAGLGSTSSSYAFGGCCHSQVADDFTNPRRQLLNPCTGKHSGALSYDLYF